jgi:hypothetical protein
MRTVFMLMLLAVVLLGGAAFVVNLWEVRRPETVLTLLLVVGVVVLLAMLGALVALLRQWGLIDRTQALGLPTGSIRAVIALGLILIFAMVSVYLIGASTGGSFVSTGLTADMVSRLPADRILQVTAEPSGTFSAVLSSATSFSQQLSQQLMTLLGTLVTAIAAFYFGSNSVTAAAQAVSRTANRSPAVPVEEAKGAAADAAAAAATADAAATEAEAAATEPPK